MLQLLTPWVLLAAHWVFSSAQGNIITVKAKICLGVNNALDDNAEVNVDILPRTVKTTTLCVNISQCDIEQQ